MDTKILIVDDALFMRTMLKKILNQAGYSSLLEAGDGEEGCQKFSQEKPDLVLLDISMPKMNGIDALKEMRRIDPKARVVMCSAVGQEAMIVEALESGACDFIVKPFKPEQIVGAIKKHLE